MATELPSASALENARFNVLVIIPNALQGIFRRRQRAVAAASRANVDRRAIDLLAGLERSYSGGPVWVRVIRERALLLLRPEDIARALEGSPEPFAPDPEAKRKGMSHFQPDALTISRGELWENRRRFTEAVLAEAHRGGELGGRIEAVTAEELRRLVEGPVAVAGGEITWDPFHAAVQRIARRLILGDGAAEDSGLSELLEEMMAAANGLPSEPHERLGELIERIEAHLARAEAGSLAARFDSAPGDERTAKAGQVPHWLFALGDTLAINALRALALLASYPEHRRRARDDVTYREACLQEAMRLWPTTPMLSRELTSDLEWNGTTVPAGTQVLIVNTYGHRNRQRLPHADRPVPEIWIEGDAAANPAFNHFSRGPQGCPGTALALAVGTELLGRILERDIEPISPKLEPSEPLPRMLDYFGTRVRVGG